MSEPRPPTQRRGLTAIDGALALIALLLIVQMWLLTATLESYLAGHREGVLPATVISAVLFLTCAGLYLFVARIDAEARASAESPGDNSRQPHEVPSGSRR